MIPTLIEEAEAERVLPDLRVHDLLALMNYAVILAHELRKAGLADEAAGAEAVLRNVRGRGSGPS
jgi:hypothetical protein